MNYEKMNEKVNCSSFKSSFAVTFLPTMRAATLVAFVSPVIASSSVRSGSVLERTARNVGQARAMAELNRARPEWVRGLPSQPRRSRRTGLLPRCRDAADTAGVLHRTGVGYSLPSQQ